jgi:hypothetical protein
LTLSPAAVDEIAAALPRTRTEWQRTFDALDSQWTQRTAQTAQLAAEATRLYFVEHPDRLGSRVRLVSYIHRDPATNAVVGAGFAVAEETPREANDEP